MSKFFTTTKFSLAQLLACSFFGVFGGYQLQPRWHVMTDITVDLDHKCPNCETVSKTSQNINWAQNRFTDPERTTNEIKKQMQEQLKEVLRSIK